MSERSGVDVESEQVEWMWRMSERRGCGQYLKRIRFLLAFAKTFFLKYTHVFLINMSLTSESEWVSNFGVHGANADRTVWRVADNLEKTLLCKFLFSWAKFFKLDTYICWFSCEI